jgi:hypothetical protein
MRAWRQACEKGRGQICGVGSPDAVGARDCASACAPLRNHHVVDLHIGIGSLPIVGLGVGHQLGLGLIIDLGVRLLGNVCLCVGLKLGPLN